MEEDNASNDDLMSRRMKSGSGQNSSVHKQTDSASTVADTDLEDTAAFDAFPRAESTPRNKPEGLSDEEWAILSSGSSERGLARPVSAKPKPAVASAQPQGHKSKPLQVSDPNGADTTSHADPRFYRRFGFADFLASAWVIIAMPIMITALAVRTVASGAFLKFEYFVNPWFPADEYGFTADDRMHYGSYVVDYLGNLDQSRYLADIVFPTGTAVFTAGEVSHMADVKNLVSLLFFLGIVGFIGSVLAAVYLSRRYGPGMRIPLKWSGLLTLGILAILTVLALIGWDRFFTGFHQVFFTDGTWEFFVDDSLIRLFPPQFWVDAGVTVGLIMLISSAVLLAVARIGYKQRKASKAKARPAQVRPTKTRTTKAKA